MLTTRVCADDWLVVITFILAGCVVAIATFAGIACITLWKDCIGFDVTFKVDDSIIEVAVVVTFAFAVIQNSTY